jgi:copper chaperone CopZ
MLALILLLSAEQVTHRVTGLFSPEREADLREAVKSMPEVELVSVDFERGEAVFAYDPARLFKGVKETERVQRFDQLLRQASRHTFGARPRLETPWEKLVPVEIPVAGLDCRACELATYEAIAKLEGVERATASYKDGKVSARIDPAKTNRDALIAALKKRNVTVKAP